MDVDADVYVDVDVDVDVDAADTPFFGASEHLCSQQAGITSSRPCVVSQENADRKRQLEQALHLLAGRMISDSSSTPVSSSGGGGGGGSASSDSSGSGSGSGSGSRGGSSGGSVGSGVGDVGDLTLARTLLVLLRFPRLLDAGAVARLLQVLPRDPFAVLGVRQLYDLYRVV
jgi:hypothetical protein